MVHYTEMVGEKGIVLMVGEYDKNVIVSKILFSLSKAKIGFHYCTQPQTFGPVPSEHVVCVRSLKMVARLGGILFSLTKAEIGLHTHNTTTKLLTCSSHSRRLKFGIQH